MKIKIKEKKDLEKYLLENIPDYFNGFYNGKHICFKNKLCFKIEIKEMTP